MLDNNKNKIKPDPTKPFLVNDNANYRFPELAKMPETQLVMLLPQRVWTRLAEYIPAFEAVNLAGRFGADPGDYEWEFLTDPLALRWWRRATTGQESLCGLAIAVPRGQFVELYGLVEIDETSPFWPDVIPEEVANALPPRAKLIAREQNRPEANILLELYREYFKYRGMLTSVVAGQPACRRGSIREVERFRDAIKALIERSSTASLPSEL